MDSGIAGVRARGNSILVDFTYQGERCRETLRLKPTKTTLKEVLTARASATQVKVDINDPATLEKYQAAQGQLQSAFGRLMAVAEAYPDLKTTKSFQDFQTQIEGTENRIGVAKNNKSLSDLPTPQRISHNTS